PGRVGRDLPGAGFQVDGFSLSRTRRAVSVLLLCAWAVGGAPVRAQAPGRLDTAIQGAFQAAYNLDLAAAAASMREAVGAEPGNPRAHRVLATVLWLTILFERGAVTIDHYIGGIAARRFSLPPPSPALDAEFRQALDRAI